MGDTKKVDDMNYFELLSWLGIGSSHPGGFPATQRNLNLIEIKPDDYVLDAGCGSGLTACHLAKTIGCRILGIDNNSLMIDKARLRAEKEGVVELTEFRVADVYDLPLKNNSFDLVMAESLTVFLDKEKVYREFLRVLKPEGRIADLEMAILRELPLSVRSQLEDCYGSSVNPLMYEDWEAALIQAGFQDVDILNRQPLQNNSSLIFNELKKDWLLIKDLAEKASQQPSLFPRLQKNSGFMKKYQSFFGYGLIYGRKPTPQKLEFRFKKIFLDSLHKKISLIFNRQ